MFVLVRIIPRNISEGYINIPINVFYIFRNFKIAFIFFSLRKKFNENSLPMHFASHSNPQIISQTPRVKLNANCWATIMLI